MAADVLSCDVDESCCCCLRNVLLHTISEVVSLSLTCAALHAATARAIRPSTYTALAITLATTHRLLTRSYSNLAGDETMTAHWQMTDGHYTKVEAGSEGSGGGDGSGGGGGDGGTAACATTTATSSMNRKLLNRFMH